ncbi:hypothetical protein [Clostridium sp. E02]|nr:hypothetical protein [Clostridium sp. E02]
MVESELTGFNTCSIKPDGVVTSGTNYDGGCSSYMRDGTNDNSIGTK